MSEASLHLRQVECQILDAVAVDRRLRHCLDTEGLARARGTEDGDVQRAGSGLGVVLAHQRADAPEALDLAAIQRQQLPEAAQWHAQRGPFRRPSRATASATGSRPSG